MSPATQKALKRGQRRAVDAPERPRSDLGCDGAAQAIRASRVVETAEAGMRVRWMEDEGPIAHYRRAALLTDRQCDALARLAEHYEEAGRRAALTGGYGGRVGGHGEISDAQAEAWKRYCRLLDQAPADTRHALALVADGLFPGISGAMGLLRRGATALADHLRYDY